MGVGDLEGAKAMLTKHSNDSAISAVSTYHGLFDTLVAKYHDGYQLEVSPPWSVGNSCFCILIGQSRTLRDPRGNCKYVNNVCTVPMYCTTLYVLFTIPFFSWIFPARLKHRRSGVTDTIFCTPPHLNRYTPCTVVAHLVQLLFACRL